MTPSIPLSHWLAKNGSLFALVICYVIAFVLVFLRHVKTVLLEQKDLGRK